MERNFCNLPTKRREPSALLTERLDHHRGRGQQQITVKHVTTNNVTADQAIISDSVTTGAALAMLRLLLSWPLVLRRSMPILDEIRRPDLGGGGGRYQIEMTINPMPKRPRRASMQSQIETNRETLPCACGSRLSRLPDAWPGRRADRQAEWELPTRYAHKRVDPGSEVRQLVVPHGAQILRTAYVSRCPPLSA